MLRRRSLLLGLPFLLAGVILVPVLADAPTDPTGNAPFEVLVKKGPAPTGVAVAPDGTVFFTDRKEGRLWQRAPHGRLMKLLDRLEQPRGLVRGADGTLYLVADGFRASKKGPEHKGVLLKRHPDEGTVTVLAEEFTTPQQLAFDKDGHLLLSTTGGRRHSPEREHDEDRDDEDDEDEEDDDGAEPPPGVRGTILRIHPETGQIVAAHAGFHRPAGVVGDAAGILSVAASAFRREKSRLNGSLFQVAPTGEVTVVLPERFKKPTGLVRDVLGQFFLAVQRDREHPKEDGLILKVAPDGSFTRFAHGFERPWGLTFDPQGNLYVTDPKAGTISRFLAPAAPVLAPLPESTTESKLALSGAAEPEATITVRGGQEDVTTLADLEGKFTLDVPLVPDQVNALRVYATGAKGEGLTSAPATAPIQQQTGPPPPSITIVLQITAPALGATITADSVLVRGFVDAGGLEVGVSVNGLATNLSGTQWAVEIPVVLGGNTVAATATTVTGAQATASISVQVTQVQEPGITLKASPVSGLGPLTVRFEVESGLDRPIVQFEFDTDGDGSFDVTSGSFENVEVTYRAPGLLSPTLRVTDDQGRIVTTKTLVHVLDTVTTMAMFERKWDTFKAALAARDIPRATGEFALGVRPRFQQVFQALAPVLPTIAPTLGPVAITQVREGLAEGVTQRIQGGKTYLYFIYWAPDSDGIWRIIEM